MSTPHGPERRAQALRRSGGAGLHDDRQTRSATERAALADQVDGWTCPRCNAIDPPEETPAGTYCRWCRLKLETCCEGAPLPPKETP